MGGSLRSYWALAIALCVSVFLSVAAFVILLQNDMSQIRTAFVSSTSKSVGIGESRLKKLINIISAWANIPHSAELSTESFIEFVDAVDLLPLLMSVCERNGSDVQVLYHAENHDSPVDCSTKGHKPIVFDNSPQRKGGHIDITVSRKVSENLPIDLTGKHAEDRLLLTIRVSVDEEHALLIRLDTLALLNMLLPTESDAIDISSKACLSLNIDNEFVRLICNDDTVPTSTMQVSMATQMQTQFDEVFDFTIHKLQWKLRIQPSSEYMAGHLSLTPFTVFGALIVISGIICWLVFRAEDKAMKLKQKNQQQAQLLVQLESQNKELDQFATMAAHDLQAPLRFMVSQAHMLDMDIEDLQRTDLQKLSGNIVKQGERMQLFVLELMSFCRAGQGDILPETINIARLISSTVDELKRGDKYPKTTITVGNLPATLLTDREMLQQIFRQLIENAMKFSQQKDAPLIQISASQKTEWDLWEFVVEDNGCGIDPAYQEKIFRPFRRLDVNTDSVGMGLAIVKKYIERLHGRIWIAPDMTEGTRFVFTLPAIIEV